MTLAGRHWILIVVVSTALLLTLAMFGGNYRGLGVVFLPLGLWLGLRREPEQRGIRPGMRVLGWIFVVVAAIALLLSVIAIAVGS